MESDEARGTMFTPQPNFERKLLIKNGASFSNEKKVKKMNYWEKR